MKLDRTLAREIKQANGDGSREARFAFIGTVREAARELSTPEVRKIFNGAVKKYGRAAVAVCIASTVIARRERLNRSTVLWAQEIMQVWTNKPTDCGSLVIRDNLHPSRIEEYAGAFIRMTTEE